MAAVGFCVPPALTVGSGDTAWWLTCHRRGTQRGPLGVTPFQSTHLGYSQFPKGWLKASGKSALVAPAVLPLRAGRCHHSWGWDRKALEGQTVTHRAEWDGTVSKRESWFGGLMGTGGGVTVSSAMGSAGMGVTMSRAAGRTTEVTVPEVMGTVTWATMTEGGWYNWGVAVHGVTVTDTGDSARGTGNTGMEVTVPSGNRNCRGGDSAAGGGDNRGVTTPGDSGAVPGGVRGTGTTARVAAAGGARGRFPSPAPPLPPGQGQGRVRPAGSR